MVEAGCHSQWAYQFLAVLGHEEVISNPRQAPKLLKSITQRSVRNFATRVLPAPAASSWRSARP